MACWRELAVKSQDQQCAYVCAQPSPFADGCTSKNDGEQFFAQHETILTLKTPLRYQFEALLTVDYTFSQHLC